MTVLGLVVAGPAAADGTPNLQLSGGPSSSVLYGKPIPVALKATLPAGAPKGYNLAFRAVLPAGTRYVAGSAGAVDGDPRQIVDPLTGRTTLIWANVDDLVANASRTVAFEVVYDDTGVTVGPHYDVGDPVVIESGAYLSTQPRDETDFSAAGLPLGPGTGTYTGKAERVSTTDLTAIEVEKSEPHPEGEIPRGLHDHQTVYTLEVTNNGVNPTTGVVLEDYLPAGLEFLGCANQADNTTDSPSNPGSSQEYPGSGPITVEHPTAGEGCVAPDLVETVELDPDGDGPLTAGVYTHVRWNDIGDLAEDGVTTLRYAAAIPIRENALAWTGDTPATTGAQTANLDNNSGPETYDEQPLLNGARAAGVYRAPGVDGRDVFDWGTLLRTAEDIAIQKSNDKHGLEQGDLTKWTIDLQVSEYRSVDDITIEDVVPNGLCPLGPDNHERTGAGLPTANGECDPVGGKNPSHAYAGVGEQTDGTFVVTWDKTSFADLAHLKPSSTRRISFWTRTRENYQADFADAAPVLSRDAVTNNVRTSGTDWVRCSSVPTDCTDGGGTKIFHQETDGQPDHDVSSSGKAAEGPSIVKQVAATYPASGDCNDLDAIQYGKTIPVYGPGDQVCWKLRVNFPANLDTKSQDVFDILPVGLTYVAGTARTTGANTVEVSPVDLTDDGRLRWSVGTHDLVDRGSQIFEVTLKSTVGSPLGHASGDVEGNLMKFSYENTAGTAFPLRDRTDFMLRIPQLSLVKGVRQLNETGTVFGPGSDHKQVIAGTVVEYRVDITNGGTAAAESSRIWDVLPAGIACTDVQPLSISDGGSCNAASNRVEWSGVAVPAASSTMLTYKVKIPTGVSPDTTFVNTAGVVEATYRTNDDKPYQLIPDNPVVRDPALPTANAPQAQDVSDVYTPAATIKKDRTTSVDERGNALADQATIGEIVTYTVTTKIPAGTTLYGAAKVVDDLGARQSPVPGTLTAKLNGDDLPASGVTVATVGNVITTTFPETYANPSGEDTLVLTFQAKVLDVDANVRTSSLPNTAKLTYKDIFGATRNPSSTVNTKIVEPKVQLVKSHTPSGRVSPGQLVTFNVKVTNQNSTNVSTAHDAVAVDVLPVGTDPVDADGNPVLDDAALPNDGGIWNATARTITWTKATTGALGALAPGDSKTLTYRVRVAPTPIAGQIFTNVVDVTTRSLDASITGNRTSTATATTAGDYKAHADDSLAVILPAIVKSVTPETATIGERVTWTVTVTLPKNVRYFDTTVVDAVPDGIDLDGDGAISCVSGCPGSDPAGSSFPVTTLSGGKLQAAWFIGDLPATDSDRVYRIVLDGHVRDTYRSGGAKVLDQQTLANTATVKTNRTNTVPVGPTTVPSAFDDGVDSNRVTVKVVEPKLTLVKSADKAGYVEGGTRVTYSITLSNAGTSPAYDVVVDDRPDSELTNVQLADGVSSTLKSKPWSAADPAMQWKIPGPIGPGETVTFTYTADVKPGRDLTSGDVIENTASIAESYGVPKGTRDGYPFVYRRYTGPQSTVRLTVAKPKLTISKTPDSGDAAAKATAGDNSSFTITVKNTDTHATAHDVVVSDVLPEGLTYAPGTATAAPSTGFSETSASGQAIAWKIATLGPDQSVKITLPVALAGDLIDGTKLTNTAKTHADEVPEDETDTGDLDVIARADLQVTKTATPSSVIPGQNVTYTLVVKNNGPSDARDSALTDTLPSYLTLVSIDNTTDCTVTGQAISCGFGTLEKGATRTVTVVAKVDPARTTSVVNRADVTTTTPDPVPTNNDDTATTPVTPKADVSIAKTVDGGVVQGEDVVTYTLKAHNNGPSTAKTVTISDAVPSDLTVTSATIVGPPSVPCTVTGAQVTCAVGELAPGADATVKLVTTAKGTRPAPPASVETHKVKAFVEQEYRQIGPGDSWSVDVTCRNGGIATDGTVQVVDTTGSWLDIGAVQIREARSIATGTYRFVIHNGTGASTHLRPHVTCLPPTTVDGDHGLDVGSVIAKTTGVLAANERQVVFFPIDRAHHAVAPGIEVLTGAARLVASEPATVGGVNGWNLTVEATADGTQATVGLRQFNDYTAAGGNPLHVHRFGFQHVVRTVTIPAGSTPAKQLRVGCPVGYEGIVGTYDLPAGVVPLGSVPEPINRDFDLMNTTGQEQTVTLDLECIALELQSPVVVVEVENTATVASVTFDPDTGNNSSTVAIGVERAIGPDDMGPGTGGGSGAGGGAAGAGDPGAGGGGSGAGAGSGSGAGGSGLGAGTSGVTPPPTLRFGGVKVAATGTTASVPVSCSAAVTCSGTVTLTAIVPVGGTSSRAVGGDELVAGSRAVGVDGVAGSRAVGVGESGATTGEQVAGSRAAKKPKTRRVVIGRATYSVKRGKTVTVKVKIAKKYRALVRSGKVRSVAISSGKVKATKKVVVTKARKGSAGRK